MSEDQQYFTVRYWSRFCTGEQTTVVKAQDREKAEERFKRDNPHVTVIAVGGGQ